MQVPVADRISLISIYRHKLGRCLSNSMHYRNKFIRNGVFMCETIIIYVDFHITYTKI